MKLFNFKRTIAASALGIAVLLGTGEVANAQNNRQIQRQQQKVYKQQQKVQKQQQRLERMQDRQYRVYRNGGYYQTDQRGIDLLQQAVNRGYQEGYRAGQQDRSYGRRANYGYSSAYRNGNYGYQRGVDANQYRYYFQQGFERGYQDGYNSRQQYGYNSGNGVNILGTILQTILNFRQF